MKKEMMNTFFLAFAAFLIATTANSVSTNDPQQSYKLQEVVCKDYLGLEKIFSQAKTAENQEIPLKVKTQCKNRNGETYVKNDDFKLERSSGAINRTY